MTGVFRKRTSALSLVVLLLITLCACAAEDSAWEQAQKSGVLRVGMDAAYPPFEFVTGENEIAGFDADLATEIGKRLDLQVEFVNIAYDGLYDALLIGRVDMLVSALVVAPQFESKAAFTQPYFNAGEFLVVPAGSDIGTMEDLAERVLAVEYGSGGDVEARKWERRLKDLTIVRTHDPASALLAVVNGEADGALVDGITARLGVGEYGELILADNVVDNLFAVAVHRDSATLLAQVDEIMWALLNDGTIDALLDKWFGPQGAP